jgi:hypothetical protein
MSEEEQKIEAEIQAKGKTAPRLTPEDIDATISGEYCFRVSDVLKGAPIMPALECLTICVLVLKNGFTVTGESACASPENYDREIGHKIARDNARKKIWPLEGYLLRENLARVAVGVPQ